MTHQTGHIIIDSLLDIFNPSNPEYTGVREHFTDNQLARIDYLRSLPDTHEFTIGEKWFVIRVLWKAIFTGT